MSTALEKVANYTPQELFLLSVLTGGAGFGGMRLLSDMTHKISPPKPHNDAIQLDLPEEKKQPDMFHTSSMGKQANFLAPFLAMSAGLPLGFLGTKALYDKYQESQGDQDIEQARKKYQQQLLLARQMNQKTAEEHTPCIDGFCEVMAEIMQKSAADLNPISFLYHKFPGMLGSHPPATPGVRPSQVFEHAPSSFGEEANNQIKSQGHEAAKGWMDSATGGASTAAADIWKLIALTGAAGMGGYMIKNHQDKREREQKSQYPSGVSYAQP